MILTQTLIFISRRLRRRKQSFRSFSSLSLSLKIWRGGEIKYSKFFIVFIIFINIICQDLHYSKASKSKSKGHELILSQSDLNFLENINKVEKQMKSHVRVWVPSENDMYKIERQMKSHVRVWVPSENDMYKRYKTMVFLWMEDLKILCCPAGPSTQHKLQNRKTN